MSAINNRLDTGVGVCPCDTCSYSEQCGDLDMACKAYAEYSYSNRWEEGDRNPTREQFVRIYGQADDVA